MAEVVLSDIIIPEVFTEYLQILSAEKIAFRASGVVADAALLDQKLAGGGELFNVPFFKDLDASAEPNISSDVTATEATPHGISTGKEIARRDDLNQVWSAMDLAGPLAGADPLDAIGRLVSVYWQRQEQHRLIAAMRGIFADNVTSFSGDMTNDISRQTSGSADSTNLFSAEAFMDTQQTMGDSQVDLGAIAMHSVVYTRARKNNLIDFIPDSENPAAAQVPTFQGLRVIVDDSMPVVTPGGGVPVKYTSYLFGMGSLLRGVGSARVPTEIYRQPLKGNGGGQEYLINRVVWCHHPRGFAWLGASQAGQTPTLAELRLAANWDRRYNERKQIKLAQLITNG